VVDSCGSRGRKDVARTLIAQFTALPDAIDRVRQMIVDYGDAVRAEAGNQRFEVYTKADDPRAFVIIEVYRDEHAFQEHLAAPYGTPFNSALEPLIVEDHSVLTFLDAVSV
jgi:quinol monooxygenase YgiN